MTFFHSFTEYNFSGWTNIGFTVLVTKAGDTSSGSVVAQNETVKTEKKEDPGKERPLRKTEKNEDLTKERPSRKNKKKEKENV